MNLTARRARWAAAAVLAAPILLLSLRFAGGPRSLYGKDFEMYYRAHAVFARESLQRDGELPRWNPRQYAGVPFLGNSQGNFYYPGNALFLAMAPEPAFEGFVVLHLLLAAFGFYRLARHLGTGRPASVLSAIAYSLSFSSLMRVYAGHLPYFVTICQAPLLLVLLLKTLDRPAILHAAGLAAMVAMILLGGNPQFVYHLGLLCAALTAWRLAGRPAPRARALLGVAAGGLLGVLVSAIQLLPSMEVASWSSRSATDPALLGRLAEPWHDFGPAHLVGFWIPLFRWTPGAEAMLAHEKALYLGILPLLLALHRLLSVRPRGPALFFGLVALVAFLDAVGSSFIVHPVLSFLPGYAKFRIPERVVWITVLALAVLSALGWDAASRGPVPCRRAPALLGGIAVIAAALIAVRYRAPEALILVGLAAVALAVLCFAPRGRIVAVAAVGFTALDLLSFGISRVYSVGRERYEAPPWYAASIGPERGDGRLLDLTTIDAAPVAHGFRLLRGCGYPVPPEVAAFYGAGWRESRPCLETLPDVTGPADPAMLRRLNVRWVVSGAEPPAPGLRRVAAHAERVLYENPDPGRLAMMDGCDGLLVSRRPTASSLSVQATLSAPGRLVVSEAAAPGWNAERNGRAIPLQAVPGGLLAVDLPDGESRVTFVYAPASWKVGRILSGLGLLALAGLLVAHLRRRGGRRQEAPVPVR